MNNGIRTQVVGVESRCIRPLT